MSLVFGVFWILWFDRASVFRGMVSPHGEKGNPFLRLPLGGGAGFDFPFWVRSDSHSSLGSFLPSSSRDRAPRGERELSENASAVSL